MMETRGTSTTSFEATTTGSYMKTGIGGTSSSSSSEDPPMGAPLIKEDDQLCGGCTRNKADVSAQRKKRLGNASKDEEGDAGGDEEGNALGRSSSKHALVGDASRGNDALGRGDIWRDSGGGSNIHPRHSGVIHCVELGDTKASRGQGNAGVARSGYGRMGVICNKQGNYLGMLDMIGIDPRGELGKADGLGNAPRTKVGFGNAASVNNGLGDASSVFEGEVNGDLGGVPYTSIVHSRGCSMGDDATIGDTSNNKGDTKGAMGTDGDVEVCDA
ncbi:unnamed protein product [Ilex paraguariensis]|uniref:Uncharacterized protein n=1 Tax=Ilex paraguariensis TaxID=185542 RepID=A0ABC8UJB3_9AQUA